MLRLFFQGCKKVCEERRGEKVKVVSRDSRKGVFSVKSLNSILELGSIIFPNWHYLEFLNPIKSKFFLLEKLVGERC